MTGGAGSRWCWVWVWVGRAERRISGKAGEGPELSVSAAAAHFAPTHACRYNTETVSPEVLSQMKAAMQESSSAAASHSFLLDDDSAIPFNHADVERLMDDQVSAAGAAAAAATWGGVQRCVQRCPPPPAAFLMPWHPRQCISHAGLVGRDPGSSPASRPAQLRLSWQAPRASAVSGRALTSLPPLDLKLFPTLLPFS